MKLVFVVLGFFLSNVAFAEILNVSVIKFENRSASRGAQSDECHGWGWFTNDLGSAFRERLVSELLKSGKVRVLERENIQEIYSNEHELINSEGVKKLKKGQFKVADYTFAGAVTGLGDSGDRVHGPRIPEFASREGH